MLWPARRRISEGLEGLAGLAGLQRCDRDGWRHRPHLHFADSGHAPGCGMGASSPSDGADEVVSVRVLIACEFSGVVRDAFRERGHDA